MSTELQGIVDAMAKRLSRPALIEDRLQRVVVYSEHTGSQLDEVRKTSILQRHATPEVIEWCASVGIASARGPMRTPPSVDLDLLPRVCIPVRHDDVLLGFVWFLDVDEVITDEEIELATADLPELSLALYRENYLSERSATNDQVRALLQGLPHQSERGVLEADEPLDGTGPVTVVVARAVHADGDHVNPATRVVLEHSLSSARRWIGADRVLSMVGSDHAALVVHGAPLIPGTPSRLISVLHGNALGLSGVRRFVVGVGDERPRLARAHESYDEARDAADVGARVESLGPVVEWSRLGVYRALSRLDDAGVDLHTLHPGLATLMASDNRNREMLMETLETYLDAGGNVGRTSAQLRLHRATLYYRLQRIEELAQTDLKDGAERLSLHLALKAARLAR